MQEDSNQLDALQGHCRDLMLAAAVFKDEGHVAEKLRHAWQAHSALQQLSAHLSHDGIDHDDDDDRSAIAFEETFSKLTITQA
eukprot:6492429-Amphidinium_carterae.3